MTISGSAFAQGLMKGVGGAAQTYFEDMRRERYDNRKLEKTFDMFKKQSDYSHAAQTKQMEDAAIFKMGLEDIATKNQKLDEWERVAQMDVKDIVYENATDTVKRMGLKGNQARKFIVDYMARKNGISKALAMHDRGLTLPDYSKYQGQDRYKDAIPNARIAGVAEMPDAESTFKYVDTEAVARTAHLEELTKKQKEIQDQMGFLGESILTSEGITPSTAFLKYAVTNSMGVINQDGNITNTARTKAAQMVASGIAVKIGDQYKMVKELSEAERDYLGLPEVDDNNIPVRPGTSTSQPVSTPAPQATPTEQPAYGTLETQYAKDQKAKAQYDMAKRVSDESGELLGSYGALLELKDASENLSEGAQEYLYGALSLKGAGAISDRITQLGAKMGDPAAQEAAKYLSMVTNITARLKHDQYGSAQTRTELADFASQLGRPGVFQNPQTFLDQLDARIATVGGDIRSKIGGTEAKAYLAEHPKEAYLYSAFNIEMPEGMQQPTTEDTPAVNTTPDGVTRMGLDKRPGDMSETLWNTLGRVQEPASRAYIMMVKSPDFRNSYGISESDLADIRSMDKADRQKVVAGMLNGSVDVHDYLAWYKGQTQPAPQVQ